MKQLQKFGKSIFNNMEYLRSNIDKNVNWRRLENCRKYVKKLTSEGAEMWFSLLYNQV